MPGFAPSAALAQSRVQPMPPLYSIEGVGLGDLLTQKDVYPLNCSPSEVFKGATWCLRSRKDKGPNGSFTITIALLKSNDGHAYYLARVIEPAFFGPNVFNSEIDRLSKAYRERARVWRMPPRAGFPNGVIAAWGDVTLVPLDAESTQTLASGGNIKVGFVVDFLQDFQRSAQEGLPIYVLSGGAGMIWNASADESGKGKLRISAVDASKLTVAGEPQVATLAAPEPSQQPSSATTSPPAATPSNSPGCPPVTDPVQRPACSATGRVPTSEGLVNSSGSSDNVQVVLLQKLSVPALAGGSNEPSDASVALVECLKAEAPRIIASEEHTSSAYQNVMFLDVTGRCDKQTLAYLKWCSELGVSEVNCSVSLQVSVNYFIRALIK